HDSGDGPLEPGRLGATVLSVLEVDVVHHLRQRLKPRRPEPEARDQDLEGAAVTDVGELGLEHVEAQLAGSRAIRTRVHIAEACSAVDEPEDQPRAGDAVDVNPLPGDPGGGAWRCRTGPAPPALLGRARFRRPLLQAADQTFGSFSSRCAEE